MSGWHLDFWFPRDDAGGRIPGAAIFQIADAPDASPAPAVMAVAEAEALFLSA